LGSTGVSQRLMRDSFPNVQICFYRVHQICTNSVRIKSKPSLEFVARVFGVVSSKNGAHLFSLVRARRAARLFDMLHSVCYITRRTWGRGVAGLTRGPVKAETAGPNPVAPVQIKQCGSSESSTETTAFSFVWSRTVQRDGFNFVYRNSSALTATSSELPLIASAPISGRSTKPNAG
jgi:hypothetical protein